MCRSNYQGKFFKYRKKVLVSPEEKSLYSAQTTIIFKYSYPKLRAKEQISKELRTAQTAFPKKTSHEFLQEVSFPKEHSYRKNECNFIEKEDKGICVDGIW